MTNWALSSPVNDSKYKKYSIIKSDNILDSLDYIIPFGQYQRYYHCFSLQELEYIALRS
jgi:hypothetical protein